MLLAIVLVELKRAPIISIITLQVILVPMVPPELMGLMENPVFLELVPKDQWENQENRETKESQETQVALDLMVLTS